MKLKETVHFNWYKHLLLVLLLLLFFQSSAWITRLILPKCGRIEAR